VLLLLLYWAKQSLRFHGGENEDCDLQGGDDVLEEPD
jgi:hypothetical protein